VYLYFGYVEVYEPVLLTINIDKLLDVDENIKGVVNEIVCQPVVLFATDPVYTKVYPEVEAVVPTVVEVVSFIYISTGLAAVEVASQSIYHPIDVIFPILFISDPKYIISLAPYLKFLCMGE